MGEWYRTQRTILAGALIAAGAAVLFTTPVALARHPYLVWVDGPQQTCASRIRPRRSSGAHRRRRSMDRLNRPRDFRHSRPLEKRGNDG